MKMLILSLLTVLLPVAISANSSVNHPKIPISGYILMTKSIHENDPQKQYKIDISYPFIMGNHLNDSAIEFNQAIQYMMQNDIASFKFNLRYSRSPKTLYIDYNLTVIKPQHIPIISLRFNIGADKNSIQYHEVVNYNFKQGLGKNIPLASLFKPNSSYKSILDHYMEDKLSIIKDYRKRPSKIDVKYNILLNEPQFNFQQNGLLLTYDSAPYGNQDVFVPYSALANIISNYSPIAVCVTKPKECEQYPHQADKLFGDK